ncbi:MAG: DsbE family thiol:disulfide interchange protein [Candidatus Puniceispirillales bacterium]
MKRLLLALPLLVFVVIGLIAVVMLNASSRGERDSQAIGFSMTGSTLPEITMPRLGGGAVIDLSAYRGQVFAINVFASWCAPCKLESPSIERLSERLPVIGINYRDSDDDARRFLDQFGNPYALIGKDLDGNTSIKLGVHGLPETFIIGADGEILYHLQGPLMGAELEGPLGLVLDEAGV